MPRVTETDRQTDTQTCIHMLQVSIDIEWRVKRDKATGQRMAELIQTAKENINKTKPNNKK